MKKSKIINQGGNIVYRDISCNVKIYDKNGNIIKINDLY